MKAVEEPYPEPPDISQMIRTLRKDRGMSQKRLAELSGLSIATIQGYEQRKFKPKVTSIIKVADALNVPASTFIFY